MSYRVPQFDGHSLITPEQISPVYRTAGEVGSELDQAAADHMSLVLGFGARRFAGGSTPARAVEALLNDLHHMRSRYDDATWTKLTEMAQAHPVTEIIREDPFTDWSFRKPRGYSGDAHLLDFIYGHPDVADELSNVTPLGRAIHDYTMQAGSAVGVRERRNRLARLVGEAVERVGNPEILTLAAGHLREAAICDPSAVERIARWIALDQDLESVATIQETYEGTSIVPVEGSVRGVLHDQYDLGAFDLAYAAGLYDYLPRAVAVRLTRKCLSRLKPNGTFMFANFKSDMLDDAYREIFMNWKLILRSEEEMWDIINASVDRNTVDAEVTCGENGFILYGTITLKPR